MCNREEAYRQVLLELKKELLQRQIKDVLFFSFKSEITPADAENITTARELFQELEKRDLISCHDISRLLVALQNEGLSKCVEIVEQFQVAYPTEAPQDHASSKISVSDSGIVTDSCLRRIALRYAGHAMDLGFKYLDLEEVDIRCCEEGMLKKVDNIFNVLIKWKGKTSGSVQLLYEKLQEDENIASALGEILLKPPRSQSVLSADKPESEIKDSQLWKIASKYSGESVDLGVAYLELTQLQVYQATENDKRRVDEHYHVLQKWKRLNHSSAKPSTLIHLLEHDEHITEDDLRDILCKS